MSENPESIQDGFVLPSEGPIAERPHRAYDVNVGPETYEWLSQTPDSARVPFVPLGNIPKEATGYLTRGDGPKAILDVQGSTRTGLPKAVGIPEGKTLKSHPSDSDVDLTFDGETISRREAIATRVVDFVCGELSKLQGDELDNLVKEGLNLPIPRELVSDVGFDATFVPRLPRGIASGWVPNSQDAGAIRRDSWLCSLSESVYPRVKKFIVDNLQITKGVLVTDTRTDYRQCYRRSPSNADVLDRLCSVNCKCNGDGSFTVAFSFSPGNLDHPVFSDGFMSGSFGSSERAPLWTTTQWSAPPDGIAWKQRLEGAA